MQDPPHNTSCCPQSSKRLVLEHYRLEGLDGFEVGFGVDELFEQLDLQNPVFVDDGGDGDRFAVYFDTKLGFHRAVVLR